MKLRFFCALIFSLAACSDDKPPKSQWSNLEEQTVILAEDNGYRDFYNMRIRNGHDFSVLPPSGGGP